MARRPRRVLARPGCYLYLSLSLLFDAYVFFASSLDAGSIAQERAGEACSPALALQPQRRSTIWEGLAAAQGGDHGPRARVGRDWAGSRGWS